MAVFDDRKKKDKKGAGLNIPVQTNIQFGGDDFDPFGNLEVGTKVELTSDGKLVAVKEEPQPAPQPEPAPQQPVAPQPGVDPFDPFASFQPPFTPVNNPAPIPDFNSFQNNNSVVLGGDTQPVVPATPATPAAPTVAPVAIDEAALAAAIASKIQIPAAPVASSASIDEAALANAIASKIQIPAAGTATISSDVTASIVDAVTKNVSKELSGSLVSQISNEVVKNIPATSAGTPEVSREVLDGVVKEVTAAVTKSIKDVVVKEVNAQIATIAPTVTQQVTAQVATQVLGTMQQHNVALETGISNVGGSMKIINDNVNSLATTIGGINNSVSTSTNALTKNVDDKLTKLESNLTTSMMGIKPTVPESLSNDIRKILVDLDQVKKMVSNPDDLPPTELEKRVKEENEKYQAQIFKNTIKPLLIAIIDTRESILRNSKVYKETGKDIPVGVYKGYAMDFQDLLEKYNVTVYQSSKGDAFDSSVHKLISKVVANKEDQNNTIANTQSCGYKYNGEIIYPEKVEVYNYTN